MALVGADRVLAVSGLLRDDATPHLAHAVAALQARGLRRLFVEGGGVTVSRFFAQRCLDRLHLAVAPVIIGDGRPGLRFDGASRLADCPRPHCSVYRMGSDQLWDLELRRRPAMAGVATMSTWPTADGGADAGQATGPPGLHGACAAGCCSIAASAMPSIIARMHLRRAHRR